jgi:hypothetical protein
MYCMYRTKGDRDTGQSAPMNATRSTHWLAYDAHASRAVQSDEDNNVLLHYVHEPCRI